MRRRSDTVRAYRDAFAERDRVYELDALAARAWPALTVLDLDGWRVRTTRGFTRHANSVWPRASGDRLDLGTKLTNVERHYAARGLPAVFQLTPVAQPKGLDRALAERGYRASEPIEVRTARLDDLAGAGSSVAGGVVLFAEPSPRWLDAWADAGGRTSQARELAERMLARVPVPSVYAVLHAGGEDVAVGRGVLDAGWLGIGELATVDGGDRGGAATLIAALVSWAAARGAAHAWIAVDARDAARVALCRQAGFRRAYTYRYRSRPRPAANV